METEKIENTEETTEIPGTREYFLKVYFGHDEEDDRTLFGQMLDDLGIEYDPEDGYNRISLHGFDQVTDFIREIEVYPDLRGRPWFISNWPNSDEYSHWLRELKRRKEEKKNLEERAE